MVRWCESLATVRSHLRRGTTAGYNQNGSFQRTTVSFSVCVCLVVIKRRSRWPSSIDVVLCYHLTTSLSVALQGQAQHREVAKRIHQTHNVWTKWDSCQERICPSPIQWTTRRLMGSILFPCHRCAEGNPPFLILSFADCLLGIAIPKGSCQSKTNLANNAKL